LNFVAIALSRGVGRHSIAALLAIFGDLEQVWNVPPGEVATALRAAKVPRAEEVAHTLQRDQRGLLRRAQAEIGRWQDARIELLLPGDSRLPPRLNDLASPPPWLFVQGAVEAVQSADLIAIVGTRNPTEAGLIAAERTAAFVVERGFGILSGLAEGIDEAAHTAALRRDAVNVAVLGHGLNVVFPAATAHLRREIVDKGGAIVTEYLPAENYSRDKFVQRNRLQAALARAVIAVEARASSGTAHTYRFAKECRRPVIALATEPVFGSLAEVVGHDGGIVISDLSEEGLSRGLEAVGRPVGDLPRVPRRDFAADLLRAYEAGLVREEDLLAIRSTVEQLLRREKPTS
jgi:DNA protecting protein DprA